MPDYSFLLSKYPEFVTKDQFYRICHISKNTALYYIKNGFIPCIDSGRMFLASIIPSGAELNFPSTPAPLLGFHG